MPEINGGQITARQLEAAGVDTLFVVVTGSGPGMTNPVTPMYAATDGGMPLVVLGGSTQAAPRWCTSARTPKPCEWAVPTSRSD